jgi:outer membrane protein TolC
LAQRRTLLELDARTQQQRLNRLRGRPLAEPVVSETHVADFPPPVLPSERALFDEARARSPELLAARLAVSQADRSTALAEKSYYPDLTVSAGIMYRGTSLPPMWQLTVGAPIPVFSGQKQRQGVISGQARGQSNRSAEQEIRELLALRVEERRAALGALIETMTLYRDRLLVQSAATVDSTLAQYVIGKVPFAAVLEANAGYLADEEAFLQLRADAERIQIDNAEVSLLPSASSAPQPSASSGTMGGTSDAAQSEM